MLCGRKLAYALFNNALINENVLSDSAKDETKHQVCGPIINIF
jgi:hypothetical protein